MRMYVCMYVCMYVSEVLYFGVLLAYDNSKGYQSRTMFLSLFFSFSLPLSLPYFQRPSASELLRHPFVQTASKTDRWQDFVRQKVQLMRQLQRELVGAAGAGPEAGQITLVSYLLYLNYIHTYVRTYVHTYMHT